MSRDELFMAVGVILMTLGFGRLLLSSDLVRRVVALNVASGGVMMLLLSLAYRSDPTSPDPIPQALVLTGIVITVSVTGLALVIIRRIERQSR